MITPADILDFQQVRATLGATSYLLLGNGFSVACDPVFRYQSLYDAAVQAGLSVRAQAVFQRLGTNNFEGVMRLLDDADWVAHTYELVAGDDTALRRDVEVVKRTLLAAVALNHLTHSGMVADARKARAREFFRPFHGIFTTNYDLLTYWVAMSETPISFQDGFREDEAAEGAPYVVFTERLGKNRGLFYLHGALHLHLAGGELRKHCWSRTQTPLTQLVRDGLQRADYPLFVAEGAADRKLEQIQRVGYLWYCLDKLKRVSSPLVVYGHSLGESDQHIVDAIVGNQGIQRLYLGVHGGAASAGAQELWRRAQVMIAARRERGAGVRGFRELEVAFFESASARVWD